MVRVVVEGPTTRTWDGRSPLVVCGSITQSLREAMRWSTLDETIVCAICLQTGQVYAAALFEADNFEPIETVEPEDDQPLDDAELDDQEIEETYEVDIAARLGLPGWPAEYVVRVLVRDVKSEPIRLAVVPDVPEHVLEALRDEIRRIPHEDPSPKPQKGVARYRGLDEVPVPRSPDIVISVPRLWNAEADERLVIRGAFRVPVQSVDRVRPRRDQVLAYAAIALGPKAVVPVTLVVGLHEIGGPLLVRFWIPAEQVAGGQATGSFEIDLAHCAPLLEDPGTFTVHALAGEEISAPQTSTTLPARMMPMRAAGRS